MQPSGRPEKASLFGGSRQRQQLLSVDNLKTVVFSVTSLQKAALNPYVQHQLRSYLKPIAAAAVLVYLAGMVLLIPLVILGFLARIVSLNSLDHRWLPNLGHTWIKESVALVPFLAVLTMRTMLGNPSHKCTVHILKAINPEEARRLEDRHPSSKGDQAPLTKRYSRALRFCKKAAFLLIADAVLSYARRGHFLGGIVFGRAFVSLSHFYTLKKVLGRDRAVILSLLGLVPYLEPWILRLVQIWRSSNLLGQELLSDYISASVPPSERGRFLKSHDVDIPLFAMPGSLLLLVPVIGPLFLIPVQAATAYLIDRLSKQERQWKESAASNAPSVPSGPAPAVHGHQY